MKAGADSAITQFFFNPDAYFHYVDEVRALGVEVPIVPGIMPFHNYAKIAQFAARDGIEIPRWVALKMEGFMDDTASIRAFGLDVVTRLTQRLIEGGAPGHPLLHAQPVAARARDLPPPGAVTEAALVPDRAPGRRSLASKGTKAGVRAAATSRRLR